MYRIVVLIAGFLIAVSGMLFLQGGQRDPADFALAEDIVIEDVAQMSARTSQAPATDLSGLTSAVRASLSPETVAAPEEADDMAAMTSGVLAGLGAPAPAPGGDDAMQQATAAVLASLNGATAPTNPAPQSLEAIISQSMQAGESDAYIDALLNEAVTSGSVQVPEALMTVDGRVDTRTLIAAIVQQSMGSADAAEIQAIAAEANAGTTPRAPAVQEVAGERLYTVEQGDSLAYIALIFYKDSGQFERIFEANRDVIASPDKIRVGQQLRIPG
ncbi:LysM peptidoglycan-binding domain-containing protein [Maritimibacter sp. UBA3975]|uniref:LysM peptidoglycan-binding domain-containing protein n=1 Tax=Maritimibacter sp. UBA3975 TaxID=1946833 RepID=UPI000C0A4E47|nr:LysM peptidoglycan-binding domain-containing protein [Maritimibacter sp. UBA3975]MAM63756.1 hypothetical protein [Maritimibacter sp.]|tara:strand:- start:15738 stop:16556 length:819 start_codon:yes stop_codon:yes gene_type:complete